jgi:uncharacterized membrane protein
MSVKQPSLYFLVLVLLAGVMVVVLGGGLFGQSGAWFLQWQHQAFADLCHQMPERSFWLGGQPMAVCSRCLGIYSGFLAGWILLPLAVFFNRVQAKSVKKILSVIVIINLVDILGNLFGLWQNTLVSRFILGGLATSSAAWLFTGSFFIVNDKHKGESYGAITTGTIK